MYIPDRPTIYSDFSTYLSPQVTPERIAREGIAIVHPSGEGHSRARTDEIAAGNAHLRRLEVTLTRRWLGFESAPRRFTIAILPPR